MALPAKAVTAAALDASLGLSSGWVFRHSGVDTRYVAEAESQLDLAETAARMALAEAGLKPDDIGLVLCAAAVPYQPIPATAPLLLARLGVADGQCMAFDVNSTCLSFVTALDIASRMIGPDGPNGGIKYALIVSSEIASRALPWQTDPATAALFGDGAACVRPMLRAMKPAS
jgi:3-oxoacyl-[acyl-carrier-protein] synthase III